MVERPIIFSAPMVTAILQGRKTQTRRVVKPQPEPVGDGGFMLPLRPACPYGWKGDRLWVRETFRRYDRAECACYDYCQCPPHGTVLFRADDAWDEAKWSPSIHMPRVASRITLEITGVRIEQLHDISEQDAIAEGIERVGGEYSCSPWKNYLKGVLTEMNMHCSAPSRSFQTLWESIHGPGTWQENPWVWVIEFERVQ